MDKILNIVNCMNLKRSSSLNPEMEDTNILYTKFESSTCSLTGNDKAILNFNSLPPEVKTKILLHLPVKSTKQARLVTSSWCDLIDSAQEFSIIVNDRKFDYTNCQFPPWMITSCLIKCFHEHEECNFLPRPEELLKLSIWGTISKPNFHRLMGLVRNIEELDLACDFFTSDTDFWTLEGCHRAIKLDRLKKFTMFSNYNIIYHQNNLLGIFRQSMPNLTKLKISLDDPVYRNAVVMSPNEVEIAISLVKFISLQKHLKVLQISINPTVYSDELWVADAVTNAHAFPHYVSNMSKIKLQICRLNVAPLYITLLRPLLQAQPNLKDFRIQSQFMEEVPIIYPENSVILSIQTLASLHLEWVSGFPLHPMTSLNFELFSHATNLKRLVLKRWWGFSASTNGMAKVINFDMIPKSIKHLTVEGFICSSREMKKVAMSPSYKLAEVNLIHVGLYAEGVGITGEIVKEFLLLKSLDRLKLGPTRNVHIDQEDVEYSELRELFQDDRICSGKIVKFDFIQYNRIQKELKQKEAKSVVGRGKLCCWIQQVE